MMNGNAYAHLLPIDREIGSWIAMFGVLHDTASQQSSILHTRASPIYLRVPLSTSLRVLLELER